MKDWTARSAGVLLDPHSLPSGTLGADALRFAQLAADAGLGVWQMLPLGPRDRHHNPFQPPSAFAADTSLLAPGDDRADAAFAEDNADWLDDWALFTALKRETAGQPWWQWPAALRGREPAALAAARRRLADAIEAERRAQCRFAAQWAALKSAANGLGLRLFGDLPLFVAHDSADAWSQRQLFELTGDGHCAAVVGVPPDAFSDDGQLWGYPPYRWEAQAAEQFRWWKRRFEVQARRFDLLRLDHFRGFAAYWRVPGTATRATEGAWTAGPGAAAIEALRPVLGDAQLVAEDLGVITDEVIALRRGLGLPGMRVLQFAFDGDPANLHLPEHHEPDSICYTGTHDNDTTAGWWQASPPERRTRVQDYLRCEPAAVPAALLDCAWASPAPLSIAPLQDLLGLGTEARMNHPGIAEGNWRWRFGWPAIPPGFAPALRRALAARGRLPAGG